MPRLNGDREILFHVLILQRGEVKTGPHTVNGTKQLKKINYLNA